MGNLNIDLLVSRILKEEINKKTKGMFESVYDESDGKKPRSSCKWDHPKGTTVGDIMRIRDSKISERNNLAIAKKNDENDEEVSEGNAFSGALNMAREKGDKSFKVGGKKYPVEEMDYLDEYDCNECGGKMYESKGGKNWIQKTDMNKGLLHKRLGVPEGDKIPVSKLKSLKAEITKKSEGDKKLSDADSKLLKQVNLALTLKGFGKNKKTLKLSENEMIDLIERVILEQKNNSFVKKTPEGLKKTEKILGLSKKTNDDYAKSVVKKMKDYVKYGSEGEYDESPEHFPESNYTLKKNPKAKKYMPSKAVDEYIEYFSYPGQTNITYDEIKPNDENIEKYLKGDSTTGNAVRDKKGKALGNVVPSKVGDRFMKNYDENVYGVEQSKASYKRQSQPVEVAGEYKTNRKLNKVNLGKKVLDKLEESKDKKIEMVSEELNKMKGLIFYDKKTN